MRKKEEKLDMENRRALFRQWLAECGLKGKDAKEVLSIIEPALSAYENRTLGTFSEEASSEALLPVIKEILSSEDVSLIAIDVLGGKISSSGWLKKNGGKNLKPGWELNSLVGSMMGLEFGTVLERKFKEKISNCKIKSDEIHRNMCALFGMKGSETLDELQSAFYSGNTLCRQVSHNIASIVGVFIRLVLIGDLDSARKFGELFRLLPHIHPVSLLKGTESTWLCAKFDDRCPQ